MHIRQRHTLDVLLMELLVIFLWFNPVVYWYRNRLKELHEFIADQAVVKDYSSYAYASMLVQAQLKHRKPQLLHTFHSFIKKRLLMLQNRPSNNWRLMKYLISMPILAALIILFALDFSKKLPDEVKKPFEVAAQAIDLDKVVVVGYDDADEKLAPSIEFGATNYQIKWEGKTCNCYPESEKTPNYFKCESFSATKSIMERAAPFELLKNGNPISVDNLWVRSNGTFQTQQGEMQLQEVKTYEEARSFFQNIPVGYTARFNFESGKEAGFYFHVFVNNEQNSLKINHLFQIGEVAIDIDPMVKTGIHTIDFDSYQKMLRQPVKMIMNDGAVQQATKMEVSVGYQYESILENKSSYRLKDFAVARWMAIPGRFLRISYFTDEEQVEEYTITLKIEQDEEWHKEPKRWAVLWGNKEVNQPFGLYLDQDDVEELYREKVRFMLNGENLKVKRIKSLTPDLVNGRDEEENPRYITRHENIPGHRFQELLDLGIAHLRSGGNRFSFRDIELENGIVYKNFMVYRIKEFDPASLYKDPAKADYLKDKREVYLNNPHYLDMKKLAELRMLSTWSPILQINGVLYTREESRANVFNELQLSENDQVTIYLPGSQKINSKYITPAGHIDIVKPDYEPSEMKTNIIEIEND